jgi:ABC-type antimicrobial peptide transport system permease subunit
MTPLNTLISALRGVAANKLRAVLTMLGIIIGVASVIAMLALGNGARQAVEARFRFLGSDQVQIDAAMSFDKGAIAPAGKILSYQDGLLMPGAASLVSKVDMRVSGSGKVRFGRATLDLSITGTTADNLDNMVLSLDVQPVGWPEGKALSAAAFIGSGRFFSQSEVLDGSDVCVLGSKTALELFAGDDPLGQTVWVNRQRCQIVGVLNELESIDAAQRNRSNPNETFFMPISTAIKMIYEEEPSVYMVAHVTDESRIDQAKAQIRDFLRQRHGIEQDQDGTYHDDFTITTRKDILGAQQDAARTFSLLLAAMASISLGVGGIGIMNVMLVSVSERTREIGVRMAVGAGAGDIIAQFLLEAVLISAAGGVLGLAIGVLSIPLAATLNQGQAILEPSSIPLALGVALLTGILFGLYPALRAARLDPIEALGYE